MSETLKCSKILLRGMQAKTFSVTLMKETENVLLKLFMNHALGETK